MRAASNTQDIDTVAATVVVAVWALHGWSGPAENWLEGLRGGTRQDDDCHVFTTIEQARERRAR